MNSKCALSYLLYGAAVLLTHVKSQAVFINSAKTFDEANAFCRGFGTDYQLASIHSAQDQRYYFKEIIPASANEKCQNKFWIGLHYQDNKWIWKDQSDLDYNYGFDTTYQTNMDCVYVNIDPNSEDRDYYGEWVSQECSQTQCFVCDDGPRYSNAANNGMENNSKQSSGLMELLAVIISLTIFILCSMLVIRYFLQRDEASAKKTANANVVQVTQHVPLKQEEDSGSMDNEHPEHQLNADQPTNKSVNSFTDSDFLASVYNANVAEMREHGTGQVKASAKVLYLNKGAAHTHKAAKQNNVNINAYVNEYASGRHAKTSNSKASASNHH